MMQEKVHKYLKSYFSKQHMSIEYSFFNDGIYLLESGEFFDIIILDIEMKVIDGIQVKNHLFEERVQSRIIFLTDYKDMVFDSIGKNVYGFVYKEEIWMLERHLNTIMREFTSHQLLTIAGESIDIYNIVYVHCKGGYCYFYSNKGKESVFRVLLNKVENLLKDNTRFIRIHRSYIVNLEYVEKCNYKQIRLKNNKYLPSTLPISFSYTKETSKKYNDYKKDKCRYG